MIFIHMIIIVYMMIFVFMMTMDVLITIDLIDENVDIVSYPEVSIGPMPEAAEENHNWLKVLDKMRLV